MKNLGFYDAVELKDKHLANKFLAFCFCIMFTIFIPSGCAPIFYAIKRSSEKNFQLPMQSK